MADNWDKEKTMIAELKTDVKYIKNVLLNSYS